MSASETTEESVRRFVHPRDHTIKVYLSDRELKEIKDKAEKLHVPMAVYVRMAAMSYRRRD